MIVFVDSNFGKNWFSWKIATSVQLSSLTFLHLCCCFTEEARLQAEREEQERLERERKQEIERLELKVHKL